MLILLHINIVKHYKVNKHRESTYEIFTLTTYPILFGFHMGTQTQSLTLQTAPVYWQSYGKVAHRLQNITPRSPTKDPSGWTNGRFQRIYLPRKQVYISGKGKSMWQEII
jgi:hypothetical protein